jgi:hypothetical protein
MHEQVVCDTRELVRDSLARMREVEPACSGQVMIGGLTFHRQLHRATEHQILWEIARLDRDGECTAKGMPAVEAVAQLLEVPTSAAR